MRHKNKQGIAYSVFPFGSSRQMFLVGEPEVQTADNYPRQVRSLLENVKTVCEKEGFTDNVAVMCHFFIADIGMKELVRQLAYEICPQMMGAVTFVPQAPASEAKIAVELWAVGGEKTKVVCVRHHIDVVATAEFDEMHWCFCGGCMQEAHRVGAYDRSYYAFQWLYRWLHLTNFRLDQVLRTWIYQGHLVMPERDTQRYKELNRARTDFFNKHLPFEKYPYWRKMSYFESFVFFLKSLCPSWLKLTTKNTKETQCSQRTVYPASTGIGADDFDVVMSAVALDTKRKDVKVVPLENPNQTSAFDYGAVYSPQSPKFSRAMAVVAGKECLIFVSGTASITDSESRHIGDPVKQTEQTLDNIAALIDSENLARHGINGMSCRLDNLECVRVYIKRPSELEIIRQICERRLPEVPTIYTVADICRPELLVEIEGIAYSICKVPSPGERYFHARVRGG